MIRVLIVDDHALVREGFRRVIGAAPDMVVVGDAPDAETALARLGEAAVDVVVLDLSMPGMGGLAALDRIREACRKTRVLVVTMHAEAHYAVRVLRAGADGYVPKSEPPSAVLEAIRVVASGRRFVTPEVATLLLTTPQDVPHASLSTREMEVLVALGGGATTSEIAARLGLTPSTVSTYIARIKARLGARSVGDLVRYAVKNGLVP